MALQLERKGMTRVHQLQGGLAGWKALNFPVEAVQLRVITEDRSWTLV